MTDHRIQALQRIADPANNASPAEQEIAQRLLEAHELHRVRTLGPPVTIYYMGAWGQEAGHYCWLPTGQRTRRGAKSTPWGGQFDVLSDSAIMAAMVPGIQHAYEIGREQQAEGVRHHRQAQGWTLVAWWDRSADPRFASIAAWAMEGLYTGDEAEQQARALYPEVWTRIDLHLGRTTEAAALRAAVIRTLAAAGQERWVKVAMFLGVPIP